VHNGIEEGGYSIGRNISFLLLRVKEKRPTCKIFLISFLSKSNSQMLSLEFSGKPMKRSCW
jgi:hypothetical protein